MPTMEPIRLRQDKCAHVFIWIGADGRMANGNFMRSFRLPDESGVAAELKDGMLNVTLKKSAKPKPKSIEISVS